MGHFVSFWPVKNLAELVDMSTLYMKWQEQDIFVRQSITAIAVQVPCSCLPVDSFTSQILANDV